MYLQLQLSICVYVNTSIFDGALSWACVVAGGSSSLTLLVGGAQRTHPLALDATDLA